MSMLFDFEVIGGENNVFIEFVLGIEYGSDYLEVEPIQ